ncbi:unnamed protein product [Amoebophrya sp. A120]|nr:unnamed protein product [Amoebophrya sp. A120]|eukprot:GSA120T00019745001.1
MSCDNPECCPQGPPQRKPKLQHPPNLDGKIEAVMLQEPDDLLLNDDEDWFCEPANDEDIDLGDEIGTEGVDMPKRADTVESFVRWGNITTTNRTQLGVCVALGKYYARVARAQAAERHQLEKEEQREQKTRAKTKAAEAKKRARELPQGAFRDDWINGYAPRQFWYQCWHAATCVAGRCKKRVMKLNVVDYMLEPV